MVNAKSYKAATHGVEALQALVAQKEALVADRAMYVCLGAVTEQAAKFARERGLNWVGEALSVGRSIHSSYQFVEAQFILKR